MRYRKPTFKQLFMRIFLVLTAVTMSSTFASAAENSTFASVAEATVGGCRSDPLVVLSDGTILDVSASISTAVSNVTDIHYVVHGPPGVKLVAAIRTPILGFAGKETFTYRADSPAKQYVTETLVHTKNNRVPVIAHTTFAKVTLLSGPPLALQYHPVHGFNGQILRTILKR